MQEEIKKLQEEKQNILQALQQLENQKGQMITRLAEIQGVEKYIQDKENNKEKK
jgi:hypothetical protein